MQDEAVLANSVPKLIHNFMVVITLTYFCILNNCYIVVLLVFWHMVSIDFKWRRSLFVKLHFNFWKVFNAFLWGWKCFILKAQIDILWQIPDQVEERQYTHLDFLWGIHNREIVYGPTIHVMKQYHWAHSYGRLMTSCSVRVVAVLILKCFCLVFLSLSI